MPRTLTEIQLASSLVTTTKQNWPRDPSGPIYILSGQEQLGVYVHNNASLDLSVENIRAQLGQFAQRGWLDHRL